MDDIFISYRRDDSDAMVGRINDRLKNRFGEERVFRDKDSIQYGRAFPKRIQEALGRAVVVLVVIGPEWLTVRHKDGRRRLELPEDWVRKEVATALRLGILLIPTLVEGAVMPEKSALSRDLAGLADLQSIPVRLDPDFDHDVERLIAAIMAASPALQNASQESPQRDEVHVDEDGDDPEELVSAGWSLVDTYPAQAARLFQQALRRDSCNASAWDGLGHAYWNDDLLEDALDAYRRSLALDPENPLPLHFSAKILRDLRRHEEALVAYDRALGVYCTDAEMSSETAELSYEKAGVLRALGRHEEAVLVYNQATALRPNFLAAWAEVGEVLARLNRHEEAVSAYARSLALHETRPVMHLPMFGDERCDTFRAMAISLRALGRKKEAEEAERKAKALGG